MPWSCQEEYDNAMWNDSLTQGQQMTGACKEFAHNAGQDRPEEEWLLTSWDTWERNPHYQGEPGPHPYDYEEG